RDFREAGLLRGAPAAFAGDQFVAVATHAVHDDRLDQALRLDRRSQFGEFRLIDPAARLVAARRDLRQRDVAQLLRAVFTFCGVAAAEQHVEVARTQATSLRAHETLLLSISTPASPRSRRII